MIREQFRRYSVEKVAAPRPRLAPQGRADPDGGHRGAGRDGRLRPHHPRGAWRPRPVQGLDVRRLRGALARLYRRRLARHPVRDRRRADPRRRHRGAEGEVAAPPRQRRDAAHGRLHRAQHRLRSREPAHQGAAGRERRLDPHRQQDLDHPRRPHPCHDRARPHRSRHRRITRACRCSSPRRPPARTRRPSPTRGSRAARSRCSATAA